MIKLLLKNPHPEDYRIIYPEIPIIGNSVKYNDQKLLIITLNSLGNVSSVSL